MGWVITVSIIFIVACIGFVSLLFSKIAKLKEGTSSMSEIAGIIRSGANVFIITEYKTILIVVVIISIILMLFVEKTAGITFLLGSLMSSTVCIIGMKSATLTNVRTTNVARETKSVFDTVRVALMGGSISGLSVQAFGLLGLVLILSFSKIEPNAESHGLLANLTCNPTIMRISTYSLGCSLVAMFNRVAGGNFTKAADISSDIVGKNRHGLPEDDPRIPSTIADFIGDIVNDIAGNVSDLLESFVATIVATIMIAVVIFNSSGGSEDLLSAMVFYPVILAAVGLLSCLIGIAITTRLKFSDNPSKQLNIATYISACFTVVCSFFATTFLSKMELCDTFAIGWISPWVSAILGIGSGIAVGLITEYYTSGDYKFVKNLAKSATKGTAFVVTEGDAIGSRSCMLPIALIGIALFISFKICGTYGVAISALGMLSFVGTTVSIDAFGPIADNAGGLAEACNLDESVREITDKLDSVGNTTAAIGKGFAICSAAFATVSLIISYVGSYSSGESVLNFAVPAVFAGGLIGGALIEFFCALLTKNTIESAELMADESERQIAQPGILEGTKRPDYEKCISMATKQALSKMLSPSVLALLVPVIGGLVLGVEFVGGILVGATIVAIPRAIFMGNSGGAFDNAKKYIEAGGIVGHGKGSNAHKASVDGDTIGDTRKDVVGVALDIFIKMMSTVANTLAPIFSKIVLFK